MSLYHTAPGKRTIFKSYRSLFDRASVYINDISVSRHSCYGCIETTISVIATDLVSSQIRARRWLCKSFMSHELKMMDDCLGLCRQGIMARKAGVLPKSGVKKVNPTFRK